MVIVNDVSVSGCVSEMTTANKGGQTMLLHIEQLVLGKFPTTYKVVVPADILNGMTEDEVRLFPERGDFVLVQNALSYEKNGEMRLKIERPEQLQVLDYKNKNKGTEQAVTKFESQKGEK